jgi:hypothetical protein
MIQLRCRPQTVAAGGCLNAPRASLGKRAQIICEFCHAGSVWGCLRSRNTTLLLHDRDGSRRCIAVLRPDHHRRRHAQTERRHVPALGHRRAGTRADVSRWLGCRQLGSHQAAGTDGRPLNYLPGEGPGPSPSWQPGHSLPFLQSGEGLAVAAAVRQSTRPSRRSKGGSRSGFLPPQHVDLLKLTLRQCSGPGREALSSPVRQNTDSPNVRRKRRFVGPYGVLKAR